MKLTSKEALRLLKDAEKSTPSSGWIKHSISVGDAAGVIASALNLDVDKAKTLGYIHDIGKRNSFKNHVIDGYNHLRELGYDEEYCNICLTHSYLNNDVNCTAGDIPTDIPWRKNFIKSHEYTIYEKIICLCDLICKKEIMTMEQRLIELIVRKGVYENTIYHILEAQKLKKYFDRKLGFNVYDLFPQIKENL